ncbi:hypothetical protein SeMB42_g06495 [Synchytrium endobioticum]|uniref:RING-type E3 ubiquitin transferase n=1 Tax=Synchytrium endobioticum TaxID=286115 RepID=A0A507CHM6_9FUNG|nr:hypothetical protein SeLEV6574_g07612 [Synchytrium endobioticum]TPX39053.1 hypothetical protein SeMB42_g06495 [Synchytrium endobioticum]
MPLSPRNLFFPLLSQRESSPAPIPTSTPAASASPYTPFEPVFVASSVVPQNVSAIPTALIMNPSSPSTFASTTSPADSRSVRILLMPHKDPTRTTPSSPFDPLDRELFDGVILKLGRQVRSPGDVGGGGPSVANYSDSSQPRFDPNLLQSIVSPSRSSATAPLREHLARGGKIIENIWFKSKVVSRTHAEMWVKEGQLYIKDGGSSSGTFLNRMRLSPSTKESRPYPLKDGDIIQLGVDYGGKQEEIYKCVIMKVSINGHSPFIQQRRRENPARFRAALRQLVTATNPYSTSKDPPTSPSQHANVDCCICLCTIGPFQGLFLAPCSHCFHYKCIRSLLTDCVMFQCPLCRQVANLEASVSMESVCDVAAEEEEEEEEVEEDEEEDLVADALNETKQDGECEGPGSRPELCQDRAGAIERLMSAIKCVSPTTDDQRKIFQDLEIHLSELKSQIGDGPTTANHSRHLDDLNVHQDTNNGTSSSISSAPASTGSSNANVAIEANASMLRGMIKNKTFVRDDVEATNTGDVLTESSQDVGDIDL